MFDVLDTILEWLHNLFFSPDPKLNQPIQMSPIFYNDLYIIECD